MSSSDKKVYNIDFTIVTKGGKNGFFLPTNMVKSVNLHVQGYSARKGLTATESRLVRARCLMLISHMLKNSFNQDTAKKTFYLPTEQMSKEMYEAYRILVDIGILIRNGYYVKKKLCFLSILNCYHSQVQRPCIHDSFCNTNFISNVVKFSNSPTKNIRNMSNTELYGSINYLLNKHVLIHKVTSREYLRSTAAVYNSVVGRMHKSAINNWTFVPLDSLYRHKKKLLIDVDVKQFNTNYETANELEKRFIEFNSKLNFDLDAVTKLLRRYRYHESAHNLLFDSGCNLTKSQAVIRAHLMQFLMSNTCRKSEVGRCYHKLTSLMKKLRKCIITDTEYSTADIKASLPSIFMGLALQRGFEIEPELISATKQGKFYEKMGDYYNYSEYEITNNPKCRNKIKKRFMSFLGLIIKDKDKYEEQSKIYKYGQAIAEKYPKFVEAVYTIKNQEESLSRVLQQEESNLLIDVALKYGGITLHDEMIIPTEFLKDAILEVQQRNEFIQFDTGVFGLGKKSEDTKIITVA